MVWRLQQTPSTKVKVLEVSPDGCAPRRATRPPRRMILASTALRVRHNVSVTASPCCIRPTALRQRGFEDPPACERRLSVSSPHRRLGPFLPDVKPSAMLTECAYAIDGNHRLTALLRRKTRASLLGPRGPWSQTLSRPPPAGWRSSPTRSSSLPGRNKGLSARCVARCICMPCSNLPTSPPWHTVIRRTDRKKED
jgi:hypothetical protein